MKYLRVEMPDGSRWDVPVDVIARSRATYYAHEIDGNVERSLREDTLPLFAEDESEIYDWAANNMNWSDVVSFAERVPDSGRPVDYQEGWCNGEKEIVERNKPDERRALVQAERGHPAGTVAWSEHETAWEAYREKCGGSQSAERIHERGGFGYVEIAKLLGHDPTTWRPR